LVAGIAGLILANIATGGAIMAALPLLLQIVGAIFTGIGILDMAKHFGKYLTQAFPDKTIAGGAKSLARGLAALTIELIFSLLFGGKALLKSAKKGMKTVAKKGVKGAVKAGAKAARKNAVKGIKNTAQNFKDLGGVARDGWGTLMKNGKMIFKGAKRGVISGAKTLDDVAKRLAKKFRFKKFKIVIKKRRFQILGEFNPWVLLADGTMQYYNNNQVTRAAGNSGNYRLAEKVNVGGVDGMIVGGSKTASKDVLELQRQLPHLNSIATARGIPKDEILDLYEFLGPQGIKYLGKNMSDIDEVVAAFKAVKSEKLAHLSNPSAGHSVFSHGPHITHPKLKERLGKGWAPEGWRKPRRWSSTAGSSKFKSFKDWVETRDKIFDAIQHMEGFDPRITPPTPGTTYRYTIKHKNKIGMSHLGDKRTRKASTIERTGPGTEITQLPPGTTPNPTATPPIVNRHRKLKESSYRGDEIHENATGASKKHWLYQDTENVGSTNITTSTIQWDGSDWVLISHFPESLYEWTGNPTAGFIKGLKSHTIHYTRY
jgi:hypothetical protein